MPINQLEGNEYKKMPIAEGISIFFVNKFVILLILQEGFVEVIAVPKLAGLS